MKLEKKLNFIGLASLIGFCTSVYQSHQFYQIRYGTGALNSFCNINSKFNCDAVMASPYAELFAGFPLSSAAAGWFLAILIISFIHARQKETRETALKALFFLSLFSVVLSTVYFAIMAIKLETFCLLCIVVDLVNLAILGLAYSAREKNTKATQLTCKPILITLGVSVLAMGGILRIVEPKSIPESDIQFLIQKVLTTPPVSVQVTPNMPTLGSSDAKVTIVEFSDFQCPHCKRGSQALESLIYRFKGQVKLVVRNYPLDPSCNPEMKHGGHQLACYAAKISQCANAEGVFGPVYHAIFENQSNLTRDSIRQYALEAGIQPEKLDQCMNSNLPGAAVARDLEEGKQLGINATPTFFLNGRKLNGAFPSHVWARIIEALLKQ